MNNIKEEGPRLGSASSGASTGLIIVPAQVGVITKFSTYTSAYRCKRVCWKGIPGSDQVGCGEQSTEDNADAGNDDVSNAEERITTTHDGASTQEDGLCAAVDGDREV